MKNTVNLPYYAIYRDKKHISNCRGESELDAVKRHLIEADLEEFTEDTELINLFSATKAKIGIHIHYNKLEHEIFGQNYIDLLMLNQ